MTAWGYGFRARWQVGKTDLPAPRNDAEGQLMTQYNYRTGHTVGPLLEYRMTEVKQT